MTLLNWEMTPDHVSILSDTLSVNGHDKRARSFMTKIYPVPHLGGVITGTGVGRIVTSFYTTVIGDLIVDDVSQLAEFAPDILRDLWSELCDDAPEGVTATIYTFGLSDVGFVGFAFRSTNDFVAEPLQHGLAAKPAPDMAKLANINGLEEFVGLAHDQQDADRALPRLDRVGIGGELWFYFLTRGESGGLSLRIDRIGRLAHFDDDRDIILAQLPANLGCAQSILALAKDP